MRQIPYLSSAIALVLVSGLPATAQQKIDSTILSAEKPEIVNSLLENSSPINDIQFNQLAINTATLPPIPIPITTEGKLELLKQLESQLIAQQRPSTVPPVAPINSTQNQRSQQSSTNEPDVLLDVPNLSVEQIKLVVENLRAHISLDARLANLLQLTAGADVSIDKVDLDIKGVKAQLLLKVRLENVARIIDRTLTTIDRNPQILERLLQTVDNTVGTVGNVANTALQPGGVVSQTVGTVGNVANTALQPGGVVSQTVGTVGQTVNNVTQPGGLLSQTVNTLGQTVQRTIDATGNIVERTANNTGGLLNQRVVGNLASLRVLSETRNTVGQIVRQVQDNSGAVIEYTLDSAGKIINPRIIRQATSGQR